MTLRSAAVGARILAVAGLVALGYACLANAQHRPPQPAQPLPANPGYRGSLGAVPPLDRTAPERAETSARIYRAILRGEARRYLAPPREGEAPLDASAVFDGALAERLGLWSTRWMVAARNAGNRITRFEAAKAHLDRMRGLESGRSLRDALEEAGRSGDRLVDVATLGEFVEVAKYFRLDAESQLEDMKSR